MTSQPSAPSPADALAILRVCAGQAYSPTPEQLVDLVNAALAPLKRWSGTPKPTRKPAQKASAISAAADAADKEEGDAARDNARGVAADVAGVVGQLFLPWCDEAMLAEAVDALASYGLTGARFKDAWQVGREGGCWVLMEWGLGW